MLTDNTADLVARENRGGLTEVGLGSGLWVGRDLRTSFETRGPVTVTGPVTGSQMDRVTSLTEERQP